MPPLPVAMGPTAPATRSVRQTPTLAIPCSRDGGGTRVRCACWAEVLVLSMSLQTEQYAPNCRSSQIPTAACAFAALIPAPAVSLAGSVDRRGSQSLWPRLVPNHRELPEGVWLSPY